MDGSTPARILLVDDDEALGRYLARVLTRGGFDLDPADILSSTPTLP